jgi:hypothetical protein
MNYKICIDDVLNDMISLSCSNPNERLPKEEQIRSRIYASLIDKNMVVSVERGYVPIEEGDSSECDLWVKSNDGLEEWIEIKRCWSGTGFHDKPKEQLESWCSDISKLARLPHTTERYFILVGMFEHDPEVHPRKSKVVSNIDSFHNEKKVAFSTKHFRWRGSSLKYVSCWVFKWKFGEKIYQ